MSDLFDGAIQMTYETAKRILDRVRDGYNYPLHIVNAALEMTGDL